MAKDVLMPPIALTDSRAEAPKPRVTPERQGLLAKVIRGLWLAILLALGAFNVWWYLRDVRPLPDLSEAERLLSRGRFSQAETLLRARLERRPREARTILALARARAGQNDFLDCAHILLRTPEWSAQRYDALLRAGQAFFQANHAREAEAAFLELLHQDPLHVAPPEYYIDACNELLKIYAIEDRWEDAYPIIWMGYDRAPEPDKIVWLLARMRPELERVAHTQAIPHMEQYVAADPTDQEARRSLAKAQLAVGERDQADQQFRECLRRRPDDVRAWRDYLSMLLEQGRLERFLEVLSRPPRGADDEPETWFFRGTAAEKEAAWDRAADNYRKAIERHPYIPKYHYRLATCLDRLGRRGEAAAERKRTQQINDARSQLPGANSAFLEIERAKVRKPGERAAAARKLAGLCQILGWGRAAQAWTRIAIAE